MRMSQGQLPPISGTQLVICELLPLIVLSPIFWIILIMLAVSEEQVSMTPKRRKTAPPKKKKKKKYLQ